jgi:hypothetical protein
MDDTAALPRLVGFGRYLRRRGLPVGTGRILTFCRAVAELDVLDPDDLYWAGRAALVSRREDIEAFDRAFSDYFGRAAGETAPTLVQATKTPGPEEPGSAEEMAVEVGSTAARWEPDAGEEAPEGEAAIRIVASSVEILRRKAFADLTEEERLRTARLIRRLTVHPSVRRIRRLRPSSTGARFDLRRTLRRSLRTQGEPFDRAWRDRGTRARPIVLILDVSGSMAPYSRALLQFAFASTAAGRKVEAFCFGTRLTRITRSLRTRDPDAAIREVAGQVADWEGGTRIGASIKELLDRWSQRSALRGAVVVFCSDGLERGDPEVLAAQMARLSRLAHRVVWVNPLKGSPRYEPLARGMAAALPHVDVFLPGHNVESLEALGEVLAG